MSFFYKDQAVEFENAAKQAGWWPSAIRMQLETISQESIAGNWKHDDSGVPFYLEGTKTLSIEEYVGRVQKEKPHVILGYGSDTGEKSVEMLAEAAFGEGCTLAARAELHEAVGPRAFDEMRKAWGCDHSLKPGTKPTKGGSKSKSESGTSNPWAKNFGGTVEQRDTKIASILKTGGTRMAADLARAAGTTVGVPLGGK